MVQLQLVSGIFTGFYFGLAALSGANEPLLCDCSTVIQNAFGICPVGNCHAGAKRSTVICGPKCLPYLHGRKRATPAKH